VSASGDDADGVRLREALDERGVDATGVHVSSRRRTLAKTRVSAAGQLLVRFDEGTTARLDRRAESAVLDALTDRWRDAGAILVSDYGYGVMTPRVIDAIAELQKEAPRVLVVDSRDPRAYRGACPTAVKPNYQEALRLLRASALPADGNRTERIGAHADRILAATRASVAAVTLDSEGALVLERGRPGHRTYANPATPARATGAGDTFATTLALALAADADAPTAGELASLAAGVAVGKDGTAACSAVELLGYIYARRKRVSDLDGLRSVTELARRDGRRVVFTNGCFDILHRGHITCLNHAKELGDLLVVGVNSDASVQRLKGADRPINPLEDRLELLAALSCVDYLVVFDEDSPRGLIRALHPDVYVKGGDYGPATLPERELVESLGGEVVFLPYVRDRSTTGVIERIRALP
jgi:D-beta-D-heptose 7-phosphate kinase/D-beta-D-heptose 1-phosphate adenosyltransferase